MTESRRHTCWRRCREESTPNSSADRPRKHRSDAARGGTQNSRTLEDDSSLDPMRARWSRVWGVPRAEHDDTPCRESRVFYCSTYRSLADTADCPECRIRSMVTPPGRCPWKWAPGSGNVSPDMAYEGVQCDQCIFESLCHAFTSEVLMKKHQIHKL